MTDDSASSTIHSPNGSGNDGAPTVRYDDAKARYEIVIDGELAGFTDAHINGQLVTFPHTEVDERFQGQGLASTLIQQALDDVRSRGKSVRATCPFVLEFIEKHPDYQDLLAA